jgi:hypothetical protein
MMKSLLAKPSLLSSAPVANGSSDGPFSRTSPAVHLRGPKVAITYMREQMGRFFATHANEMSRLSTATLYMPLDHLLSTAYADIFEPYPSNDPSSSSSSSLSSSSSGSMNLDRLLTTTTRNTEAIHASHLVPLFSSDFCAALKMSRELPLSVVTNIGGGGALAKLAKARSVMKGRKEWSQVEELPVSPSLKLFLYVYCMA